MPSGGRRHGLASAGLFLSFCALCALGLELGLRRATHGLYHWQYFRGLDDRVDDLARADAAVRVGVFGDSFVEFFRGLPANVVSIANEQLAARGARRRLFNFGFSGSGVRDYAENFHWVAEHAALDEAVFSIYTGNDYPDYYLHEVRSDAGLALPQWVRPEPKLASRAPLWNELFHRSAVATFVFRMVVKGRLGLLRKDDLEALIAERNLLFRRSPAELAAALARMPADLVDQARGDVINKHMLVGAAVHPAMYRWIAAGFEHDPPRARRAWEALAADVAKLLDDCDAHGVACRFVFAEADVFVDARYHDFYRSLGYELDDSVVGEPAFTRRLKALLARRDVPFLDLRPFFDGSPERLYFERDPHWNPAGHRVAAAALVDWLASDPPLETGGDVVSGLQGFGTESPPAGGSLSAIFADSRAAVP